MMDSGNDPDRGGYDYEFVDTPLDMMICKICHHPSIEPHLSDCCGHTFCKSCLNCYKVATKYPMKDAIAGACPVCRSEEFRCVRNKQTDRMIKSLEVFCTNKSEGCKWKGEINSINHHLAEDCQYNKVSCPNGCAKTFQQGLLINHVENECIRRKVSCPHCHTSGEHRFIEDQHKDHCPKFPLPCPNNCEAETIPREEMQIHLDTICPLEIVQCEYHVVGCEVRVTRRDLEKHKKEGMESHLSMTTQQLASAHATLTKTLAEFHANISEIKTAANIKISEIEAATQKKVHELENRLDFESSVLKTVIGEWAYKINSAAVKSSNKTVPLIVRISHAKLRDKELLCTDPFFTHPEGYKIMLLMTAVKRDFHFELFDKFMYVPLYVYLMDGPYDDKISWPMKRKLKITLLNQIRDGEHYPPVTITYSSDKPVSHDMQMVKIGVIKQFINYEDLYQSTATCRFLRNDGLLLQVEQP